MITKTSLNHPIVRKKIFVAALNVKKHGYSVDHVRNRNGDAYIAIRDNRLMVATDRSGRDITNEVRLALIAEIRKRKRKKYEIRQT